MPWEQKIKALPLPTKAGIKGEEQIGTKGEECVPCGGHCAGGPAWVRGSGGLPLPCLPTPSWHLLSPDSVYRSA